jgi:hypothetical protein
VQRLLQSAATVDGPSPSFAEHRALPWRNFFMLQRNRIFPAEVEMLVDWWANGCALQQRRGRRD